MEAIEMASSFDRSDRPLSLSRTVLRILVKLNILFGVLIFALLVSTFIAAGPVFHALGAIPTPDSGGLFFAMRGIMVIGILAAPVLHLVYTRLLAIVETVNDGDPFVSTNAIRLQAIAWAVFTLELMHVGVIMLANTVTVGTEKVDVGGKFSVTPWLTILLLFVLARVFDQGSRMRDELAATV
jgi:hypothetical protein